MAILIIDRKMYQLINLGLSSAKNGAAIVQVVLKKLQKPYDVATKLVGKYSILSKYEQFNAQHTL